MFIARGWLGNRGVGRGQLMRQIRLMHKLAMSCVCHVPCVGFGTKLVANSI